MSLTELPDALNGRNFTTTANEWIRALSAKSSRRSGIIRITNTHASTACAWALPESRSPHMCRFAGDNDNLTSDSLIAKIVEKTGSVVVRFQLDDPLVGTNQTLFSLSQASAADRSLKFYVAATTGKLTARMETPVNVRWLIESDAAMETEKWINAELFHDGERPYLKVDGKIIDSQLTTSNDLTDFWLGIKDNADALSIGSSQISGSHGEYLNGDIDTITIYNGYDGGGNKEVIGDYVFSDAEGATTITDSGPNKIDASLAVTGAGGVVSKGPGTSLLAGETVEIKDIPEVAKDLWLHSTAAITVNVKETWL